MIGELVPEQLRPFVKPVPVKMRIANYETIEFFGEAVIEVDLSGARVDAVVPIYVLDLEDSTVEGVATGMFKGMVMVSFPPTQDGQTTLAVPEDLLTKIA